MSASGPAASPPASKKRLAYFDNVRFWLILLVPLGHTLAYFKDDSELAQGLYTFIYLFHMPAFALITGHVSRRFEWNRRTVQRTVETVIVPILIFETLCQLLTRHYTDEPAHINPFATVWLGWFLWGLLLWRLATPFLQALRWPVFWAALFALLLPVWDFPNFLGFIKAMSLLPFYALGMVMRRENFALLARPAVRIVSLVALILALGLSFLTDPASDTTYLLWKATFEEAPMGQAFSTESSWELPLRALLLLIGLALSLALCSLVSWRESWITAYGARTLYCYLLHGFILLWAMNSLGLDAHVPDSYGLALMVGLPLLTALLLLTPPVKAVFRYAFEPNLSLFFRADRP